MNDYYENAGEEFQNIFTEEEIAGVTRNGNIYSLPRKYYAGGEYVAVMNKHSGDGFSDIYIKIEDEDTGIVIEVKYAENMRFAAECKKALAQIKDGEYVEELRADGCLTIYKYGIACFKRKCGVVCEKETVVFDERDRPGR